MAFVKKQFKKRDGDFKREKPEFDQKMIDLRRVARVVKGGRRFSFRATLVVGNRKGEVGVGTGKGADTTIAMEKAARAAKNSRIKIPINEGGSIPHETEGKFAGARVLLRPAGAGKGLVAGSSARVILDLAGVKNATAKILSKSKNKINNAKATMEAIKKLKTKNEKVKTAPVRPADGFRATKN